MNNQGHQTVLLPPELQQKRLPPDASPQSSHIRALARDILRTYAGIALSHGSSSQRIAAACPQDSRITLSLWIS
eukprot:4755424-Pyramimonas_sp.AAC.1